LGELKSKPAQTSVHVLNSLGIQPDILIARSSVNIDQKRLEKLGLYSNIPACQIFTNPDMDTVYKIPLHFHNKNHHLATTCLKLLNISPKKHHHLNQWKDLVDSIEAKKKKKVTVGMIGKYFNTGDFKLPDSYVSVIEALKSAAWASNIELDIKWIDCEDFSKKDILSLDGVLVPQGWGKRGVEGKLEAIKIARTKNIPFLGLCFGMQMAVIEFARNVLNLKDANTTEADPDTSYPVVHVMPDQQKYLAKKQYGGTIRLGAWPCKILENSKLSSIYKSDLVDNERHRHRYEFNTEYKDKFEKAGLIFSGVSPDGKLMEAIEIPKHKFFIATQFHPEYISRPLSPHPLFLAFIKACAK
jgi:CTP synthase